jgi:LAO/AO transport system kinase
MRPDNWNPPIIKTIATEGKGVSDLAVAIESYREFQQRGEASATRRQAIARWRILELLRERLLAQTLGAASASERLEHLAAEVAAKRRDPYSAVDELINASAAASKIG